MPFLVEPSRGRNQLRIAAFALIALAAAGCSSDVTRFDSNPFRTSAAPAPAAGEVTGSVRTASAVPAGKVEARPLEASPLPAPGSPATVPSAGVAGGGRGMASYHPPQGHAPQAAPDVTGSVAAPRRAPQPTWKWDGGTPVTVGPGETVDTLAKRYGVPAGAILQANNISAAHALKPGQRLVIPRFAQPAAAPVPAAPATAPAVAAAPQPKTAGGVHVVAPGETLMKLSRLYGKSVSEIAKANKIPPHQQVKIGDRIIIPGARHVAAQPPAQSAPQPAPQVVAANQPKPGPAQPQAKQPEPQHSARVATPAAEQPVAETPVKAAEATGSMPTFRWPVRGRVIAGFGPKTNGQQNDGINLAVPEGTPVKAAEDGVVAYAGNELKGYGNLVLIRHGNGYVTAYAHASEVMVKRGEQIKRGQVIAKSGQTGNVGSPQLHFEIRKGATPVDPMQFLNGV
jgi:murein DD-endopeptidase MepM/ murein hydrolase activator NlpD